MIGLEHVGAAAKSIFEVALSPFVAPVGSIHIDRPTRLGELNLIAL